MLTSHPDDETLFAGGLLARFAYIGWTVICCSIPRLDPLRAWRFFDACAVLGVQGRLFPVTERPPTEDLTGLEHIDLSAFDCIVTHGAAGEYGHRQHRQIHHFVVNNHSDKRIIGFGWRPGGQGTLELKLTAEETALKRAALDRYGEKAEALRALYCGELGVPEGQESYDIYRE
jgi:LmbE family N-acetylglucosaminyl deacetylase